MGDRARLLLLLAVAALPACSGPVEPRGGTPGTPATTRVPALRPEDPLHGRVEGSGFANHCRQDADCVRGGCSLEVCSADPNVVTTCEVVPWPVGEAACGCVQGQCVWYRVAASGLLPGQTLACPDGVCGEGLTCVSYLGIAGDRGPVLRSCEVPCAGRSPACPPGQRCVSIADGPAQVCRPAGS